MAAAALLRRLPAARAPATALIAARPISDSTAALTIETSVPFTSHIVDPPSRDVTTTPAELLTFFRDMSVMRRMEKHLKPETRLLQIRAGLGAFANLRPSSFSSRSEPDAIEEAAATFSGE